MSILNDIGLEHYEKLVRDNERMRTSLQNIATFAERSAFGAWRQKVYDMAKDGMPSRPSTPPSGGGGGYEPSRPTHIAPDIPEALRSTSPGQDEASDEVPEGRPVRVVVELPPGACSETELANRLKDILRYPIKVLKGGNYARYRPQFKSYGRVVTAEKIKERRLD